MLWRHLWRSTSYLGKHHYSVIRSPFPDVTVPSLSLPQYVWHRADEWQDKTALVCGVTGRQYTYSEARELSRRFAAALGHIGIHAGDRLAIVLPNTPEWPLIFLGALEAGVTVTTANPGYSTDELRRQLQDSEASAVVTMSTLYSTVTEALKGSKKHTVIVAPGLENASSPVPNGTVDFLELVRDEWNWKAPELNIDDTAVLPYSSGTSGLPKGVMLNHRSIIANCVQINNTPSLCLSEPARGNFQERIPAILPFFHIYGMVVVLATKLAQGAKIITLPKFDSTSFLNTLAQHQTTLLYLVPPLLLFLSSHPNVNKNHLEHVRYVMCGAAPLGAKDVERFLDRAPASVKVVQVDGLLAGYGMTETSPVTLQCTKGNIKYDSVGVPIPNTEVKITQPDTGALLPAHQVGEVCVRGPQVMQGYFKRPEATAEIIDAEGWLHTGDLGYYDDERSFYVVDRLKELIKVKGFQVAPAELEELLRSHPGVSDVAVIGVPHERMGEVPRAFVVPRTSHVTQEELIQFVGSKVAQHKHLAGGVQFVEAIPKNPSGKILRRKLRNI